MNGVWFCFNFVSAILAAIEFSRGENSIGLKRGKRNFEVKELPESCDFGTVIQLTTCQWTSHELVPAALRWRNGLGESSYWIGGPPADHTHSERSGGYMFYETSNYALLSTKQLQRSPALLFGPMFNHTGPAGLCLSFYFNIHGPSAKGLRVLLRNSRNEDTVLWESLDEAHGRWQLGEVAYSYGDPHSIIFEAVPANLSSIRMRYRGHVALDDIKFDAMPSEESCLGHCTFESGFCGWENMEEDDFDFEISRGSDTFLTGPPRDFYSYTKDEQTGGFAYINTAYPRRPGDTAMLSSPTFDATGDNNPLCIRFATHMYGNGVGTLRLVLRNQEDSDRTVWEMTGSAGNVWHRAQATLSSLSPFQLLFIAIVGNRFGNVAIDDISLRLGSCPVVPQTAAKDSGDCSFEVNMCGWSNAGPQDELDDVDWARQNHYDFSGPTVDHTRGDSKGYYVNLLPTTPQILKGGTRAWLVSQQFRPSSNTRCLSFYYYMYEPLIDPAGLSLGSLRVYIRLLSPGKPLSPIWRLYNHQGEQWHQAKAPIVLTRERTPPQTNYELILEGVWGEGRVGYIAIDDVTFFDGDCSTEPFGASALVGECFFERDTCGWIFVTVFDETSTVAPTSEPQTAVAFGDGHWKLATVENKPAGLLDHTFRSPTGFVFFDVFNRLVKKRPKMRSQLLELSQTNVICLGFWFVAFGRSESTSLEVVLIDLSHPEGEKKTIVWKLEARNFPNATRTEWSYAQVSISARKDYYLQFEGESSDGGFAVDDITFYDGSCHTRPPAAEGKG